MPNIIYDPKDRKPLPALESNAKLFDPSLYEISKGLQDAVNVSLKLGIPLLLTGEPGTGKTQLAHHLAWFFNLGKALVFHTRTTSTATDLFYRYDSLRHFQYAQTSGNSDLSDEEIEERFIRYEALGLAIRSQKRQVVLIDEIDKAPRDLPNDLLAAVEQLSFEVPEINRTGIKAISATDEQRPIIILTSNSEKNLPDAFLRRVAYYHIPFPGEVELARILNKKQLGIPDEEMEILIQHFLSIRKNRKFQLRKNPATAELIFWAMTLRDAGFPIGKLRDLSLLSEAEKEILLGSYSLLVKSKEDSLALEHWVKD